ncbi:MAG: hypothetical protein ABF335_03130 [Alphaproteobacteria bacterium]
MDEGAQTSAAGIVWTIVAIAAACLLYFIAENEGWLDRSMTGSEEQHWDGLAKIHEQSCVDLVEGRVQHRFRWMEDGHDRFNIERSVDDRDGDYRYAGDKIEMMNGYGAWFRYGYRCTFRSVRDYDVDMWKVKG